MFTGPQLDGRKIPSSRYVWFRALPLVLLLVLIAGLLFQSPHAFKAPPIEWKKRLTWADGAVRKNDIYGALAIYDQVFREASFAEDWEALLAVACGLIKLRRLRGIGLTAETVLVRIIPTAAEQHSWRAVRCAAKGLKSLGVADIASATLSRIPEDWLAENDGNESQQGDACGSCNYGD
jgi:hypothetical protein